MIATPTTEARGVLFDLDGTLIDSTPSVHRSWGAFAARMGIEAEPIFAIMHGRIPIETMRMVVPDISADVLEREVSLHAEAEQQDTDGIQPTPSAIKFLDALKDAEWGIVTSCGRDLALARMRAAGIPEPAVLITADDVQAGKPDPEGYLLGATRLHIDPSDIVVFEDAEPGTAAALRAGMRVVALTTTHPLSALSNATWVVSNLTDVTVTRTIHNYLALRIESTNASNHD